MHDFSDMQQSQTTHNLYCADIFLSLGGIILCSIKSLIIILFFSPLASLIPLSYGALTMLLFSFNTDTWNKTFGAFYLPDLPSIYTLRQ